MSVYIIGKIKIFFLKCEIGLKSEIATIMFEVCTFLIQNGPLNSFLYLGHVCIVLNCVNERNSICTKRMASPLGWFQLGVKLQNPDSNIIAG